MGRSADVGLFQLSEGETSPFLLQAVGSRPCAKVLCPYPDPGALAVSSPSPAELHTLQLSPTHRTVSFLHSQCSSSPVSCPTVSGHFLFLFDLKQINNYIRISLDDVGFLSSGYMRGIKGIPDHRSEQIKCFLLLVWLQGLLKSKLFLQSSNRTLGW